MRVWIVMIVALVLFAGCASESPPLEQQDLSPPAQPSAEQPEPRAQPTYEDVDLDEYYREALDTYSNCPDGYALISIGDERFYCEPERCPDGYTIAVQDLPVGLTPRKYCRIDKEWEEFTPCERQEDCEGNLTCMSPDYPAQGFRCVPTREYRTACGFYPPDGKGWCI